MYLFHLNCRKYWRFCKAFQSIIL